MATAQCRSRVNSEQEARREIERRVVGRSSVEQAHRIAEDRKSQVGSGMRGDKIRTYRFQDDTLIDHRSDKKVNLTQVMKGNLNLIW